VKVSWDDDILNIWKTKNSWDFDIPYMMGKSSNSMVPVTTKPTNQQWFMISEIDLQQPVVFHIIFDVYWREIPADPGG
jgi:hypothetical protein